MRRLVIIASSLFLIYACLATGSAPSQPTEPVITHGPVVVAEFGTTYDGGSPGHPIYTVMEDGS